VVHTLMNEHLPGGAEQRTSIAHGDDACEFHIPASTKRGESYGLS
jgi:hypothetical protein